jgi:hypothetical protein
MGVSCLLYILGTTTKWRVDRLVVDGGDGAHNAPLQLITGHTQLKLPVVVISAIRAGNVAGVIPEYALKVCCPVPLLRKASDDAGNIRNDVTPKEPIM